MAKNYQRDAFGSSQSEVNKTGKELRKKMFSVAKESKDKALKGAMTGEARKRAMKKTRNFESLRPKGGKTHDILKKFE